MGNQIRIASISFAFLASLVVIESAGAQTPLRPYPAALLHQFLDSANVYPESVAIDQATGVFYVGSVKEGTIYKGKVGTPGFEVFSRGGADGRTIATGMFLFKDKLIVLGRQTGLIFVYDTRDAHLISKMDNGLRVGQTHLNDVTVAPDGSAYVTDSINPALYRIAPNAAGQYELQTFLTFDGTPIKWSNATGPAGINLNGIVISPDGRYLLVTKRNENAMFRIDLRSKAITPVTVATGMLTTPDGLFLEDHTLYVAQNTPKSIAVFKLSPDFSRADLESTITNPTFAFPTGVARYKNKLLVVSAQFDTAGSPAAVTGPLPAVVPFWVTELDLGSR